MNKKELIEAILYLKAKKNAVIVSHNYQRPEIQEISDYLGDSLELAQRVQSLDSELIVFCGVHFMAESAKILCPDKKILLPEESAGCPLADCATPDQVREFRKQNPEAVFIAYINTSAAVKAECDVCATSANAMKIIDYYKDREIVYLPDKNLAAYAESILQRPIIKWAGQCYVHHFLITPQKIQELKKSHPEALVMAHPEAPKAVLDLADIVTGTSGMLRAVQKSAGNEFIIGTESGLADRMRREFPGKIFYAVESAVCGEMKLTTLSSLYHALRDDRYEIHVPPEIASKARLALVRMLELSE